MQSKEHRHFRIDLVFNARYISIPNCMENIKEDSKNSTKEFVGN